MKALPGLCLRIKEAFLVSIWMTSCFRRCINFIHSTSIYTDLVWAYSSEKQILYPPGAYVSVEETKNLNKEISIYMIGLVVRSGKKEKQGQWSIVHLYEMAWEGFFVTEIFDETPEDLRTWELQIFGWGGSIVGKMMACAEALAWENANEVADSSWEGRWGVGNEVREVGSGSASGMEP